MIIHVFVSIGRTEEGVDVGDAQHGVGTVGLDQVHAEHLKKKRRRRPEEKIS
jgi:hypothetical protein